MSNNSNNGVYLSGLLTTAFIVLKLCGVIKWPWIWVLSPFWVPLAGSLLIYVLYLVGRILGWFR